MNLFIAHILKNLFDYKIGFLRKTELEIICSYDSLTDYDGYCFAYEPCRFIINNEHFYEEFYNCFYEEFYDRFYDRFFVKRGFLFRS